MIRHIVSVVFVLCLFPATLHAQSATMTVTSTTASVHKTPSVGSPVVGQAPLGSVIEVKRELGSWVAVQWPAGSDTVAYIHVVKGKVAHNSPSASAAPSVSTVSIASPAPPARGSVGSASTSTQLPSASQEPVSNAARENPAFVQSAVQSVAARQRYVTPTHVFGLGARLGGSTTSIGVSARAWQRNRVGLQVAVSHAELTSTLVPEHLSSLQIEPSVLYLIPRPRERLRMAATVFGVGLHTASPDGAASRRTGALRTT